MESKQHNLLRLKPVRETIISKATMIRKNDKDIREVYKIARRPLGAGAYGVVSKCKHKITGQERAVKKITRKKIKNLDRFK